MTRGGASLTSTGGTREERGWLGGVFWNGEEGLLPKLTALF